MVVDTFPGDQSVVIQALDSSCEYLRRDGLQGEFCQNFIFFFLPGLSRPDFLLGGLAGGNWHALTVSPGCQM